MLSDGSPLGFERHVVLVAPEVHWNVGNAGRTCLGIGARLHLIRPLGFSLSDRHVKRAGLDYWPHVQLSVWDHFSNFMAEWSPEAGEILLFAKAGSRSFRDMRTRKRMFLVFGSESSGLPPEILAQFPDVIYHIPITSRIRCLNLSTSVGIALYESIRDVPDFHGWKSG